MTPIRLNVCLLLDPDYAVAVVELANQIIDNMPKKFSIDNINFFPHVTLYTTTYLDSSEVIDAIKTISTQFQPFVVQSLPNIDIYPDGHFGIDFSPSRASLLPLHQLVISALNPLRSEIDPVSLVKYSKEDQELIKSYGYRYVFGKFRPHLTLGQFQLPIQTYSVSIPTNLQSAHFGNIGIAVSGQHGTITEVLKTFSLKP